jgi:hypothetical protein
MTKTIKEAINMSFGSFCQPQALRMTEEERRIFLLLLQQGISGHRISISLRFHPAFFLKATHPFQAFETNLKLRERLSSDPEYRASLLRSQYRRELRKRICNIWKALENEEVKTKEEFLRDIQKDLAESPLEEDFDQKEN